MSGIEHGQTYKGIESVLTKDNLLSWVVSRSDTNASMILYELISKIGLMPLQHQERFVKGREAIVYYTTINEFQLKVADFLKGENNVYFRKGNSNH